MKEVICELIGFVTAILFVTILWIGCLFFVSGD